MPIRVSYPGVYIQEVSSGVRTITGVSTSIAAFVGMIQRGPLNRPTNVLNFTDYERIFGSDTSISEMTDQVRLFFQNGGQSAYIMRIANNAKRAQVSLNNEFGNSAIRLAAKEHGILGNNIRISVNYNTDQPEATFNLEVFREVFINGNIQAVETEFHLNLSMNPSSGRFINIVLERDSSLITVITPEDLSEDDLPFSILAPLIQGYAIAGVLLSAVNDVSRIVTAIQTADPNPAQGSPALGRFEISVDGSPFVDVPLSEDFTTVINPDTSDPDPTFGLQSAINTALGSLGSVRVRTDIAVGSGTEAYLAIISDLVGGSVRLRRSSNNDIAGLLAMGTNNGGLEVDGYAIKRPAPNGFFSRLGTLDNITENNPVTTLNGLSQFLQETATNLATITFNDVNGSTSVAPEYAGTLMLNGTVSGEPSLLNGGENLDAIITAINTAETNEGEKAIRWTAQRSGYRVVLTPNFGNTDTDIIASIINTDNPDTDTIGDGTDGIWDLDANVARYRLGNYGSLGTYVTGNREGDNGSVPSLTDYDIAYRTIDREVDIFNLLLLPRSFANPRQTDEQRAALWGPASIFCQSRRAFLLVDPPSDFSSSWTTAQEARDSIRNAPSLRTGVILDHAAVYWPRLRIIDPMTGAPRIVDPSGAIAGVMARIDSNRGVWKAPAGLEADIRGIRGIEYSISDPENGLINPEAVNALRSFPTGIVSWGARTMAGSDSNADTDYRYVPVRRIALFIEESLFRGLKFAVFEPNDEPLWAQIRLAAGAFMNNLFRQGAFQGQKASDAYFVKVDSETTTQNDINLGIVNVLIGFAPLRPAEFVVITIQQMAGQVQT